MNSETNHGDAEAFLSCAKTHSHTGTGKEISTLAIEVARNSASLEKVTMALCRQELENLGIGSKVFSKLKVIGETLLQLNEKERGEVIRILPASYGTIHVLCGLKPEELVTATKLGVITKTLSIRAATAYVKQIRYPQLSVRQEPIVESRSEKQDALFTIVQQEGQALSNDEFFQLGLALKGICMEYGVELRRAASTATSTLRQASRAAKEIFWRSLLDQHMSETWFKERPEAVRKQFNLKSVQELHNAPLRSFTGFLQLGDGGKGEFWEKHGRNYIAKVHMEMERTDNNAQRYNLKRRIEGVLADRQELAVWTNLMLKQMLKQVGYS